MEIKRIKQETNSMIGNKYRIIEKIGSGSFGEIYKGENIRTKEMVAIKMELIDSDMKMIANESRIYQYLKGSKLEGNTGFPTVKWYGIHENHYYMVMNLLGESLKDLQKVNTRFSLKMTIHIGIKMLKLLETIHEKGLIHRDIKPDNFLFGINEHCNDLYLIDFGLCKRYIYDDGRHIPMKQTKQMIGSLNFCSIHSHLCMELGRRDDLESLGYIMIYLFMGKLEWSTMNSRESIHQAKINILMNRGFIPDIFLNYFEYIRCIQFEEKPDYEFIRNILEENII